MTHIFKSTLLRHKLFAYHELLGELPVGAEEPSQGDLMTALGFGLLLLDALGHS